MVPTLIDRVTFPTKALDGMFPWKALGGMVPPPIDGMVPTLIDGMVLTKNLDRMVSRKVLDGTISTPMNRHFSTQYRHPFLM